MKIKKFGEARVIMSNPMSRHNYFGWPTMTRLQNGKNSGCSIGFQMQARLSFRQNRDFLQRG